ncbi:MAG TPA: hypothetical protein VGS79_15610, partial [Puia sp.]|nr:hypothetical protein [Puia sp.]
HQTIEVYRRNLQKTYVESLISVLNPATPAASAPGITIFFGPNTKNTDLPSIARAELASLRSQIQAAIPSETDKLSKYHLVDLAQRIKKVLEPWLAGQ